MTSPRTIQEIRDHWLNNRSADGTDWQRALGAVYQLGWSDAELVYGKASLEPVEIRDTDTEAL